VVDACTVGSDKEKWEQGTPNKCQFGLHRKGVDPCGSSRDNVVAQVRIVYTQRAYCWSSLFVQPVAAQQVVARDGSTEARRSPPTAPRIRGSGWRGRLAGVSRVNRSGVAVGEFVSCWRVSRTMTVGATRRRVNSAVSLLSRGDSESLNPIRYSLPVTAYDCGIYPNSC